MFISAATNQQQDEEGYCVAWNGRRKRQQYTASRKEWEPSRNKLGVSTDNATSNHVIVEVSSDNLWRLIKNRRSVSPLRRNGLTFNDSKMKADIWNHQFCPAFTIEKTGNIPSLGSNTHPSIPEFRLETFSNYCTISISRKLTGNLPQLWHYNLSNHQPRSRFQRSGNILYSRLLSSKKETGGKKTTTALTPWPTSSAII